MTIPAHIEIRKFNERLGDLESCASLAPSGTYEQTKEVVAAIGEIADDILLTLKLCSIKAHGDDRLRTLEAAIYRYILECNPDAYELLAAEGFGAAMEGPARPRVIAQTERDRDFLLGSK